MMGIAFLLDEYRVESGRYPENLDRLPKHPAVDPFSGEPYRYRMTDGGYVLYSVSANRTDDRGVPSSPQEKVVPLNIREGDIVWTIE